MSTETPMCQAREHCGSEVFEVSVKRTRIAPPDPPRRFAPGQLSDLWAPLDPVFAELGWSVAVRARLLESLRALPLTGAFGLLVDLDFNMFIGHGMTTFFIPDPFDRQAPSG